jgi:reverse gyrase
MDKIEEGKEDYEKVLRKLYFDVKKTKIWRTS